MTETTVPAGTVAQQSRLIGEAIGEVKRVIVGQEHMVEPLMVSLLAKGHCLLEGVPGVAKTLAVRSFRQCGRRHVRPDPVHPRPGPVRHRRHPDLPPARRRSTSSSARSFVNFVLADEINRAPAKVQSAMLELMAEQQVSIGGQTFPMPKPFIVIATQNPIESEGVYPLPEAQRDRFLLKIDVRYPRGHEEFEILRRMSVDPPSRGRC